MTTYIVTVYTGSSQHGSLHHVQADSYDTNSRDSGHMQVTFVATDGMAKRTVADYFVGRDQSIQIQKQVERN